MYITDCNRRQTDRRTRRERPLRERERAIRIKKMAVWKTAFVSEHLNRLCPTRGPHAAKANVLWGPVSFSCLCMYKTMAAYLYFDHLKFDIFDAIEFAAWWEEAGNSIDFLHCSRKVWSTIKNLLAGLQASLVCAPFQQIPLLHSSCRRGHTRRGTASPRGLSTSSCPTYGRSQHLMEIVTLVPLSQRGFLTPSATWRQENPWD